MIIRSLRCRPTRPVLLGLVCIGCMHSPGNYRRVGGYPVRRRCRDTSFRCNSPEENSHLGDTIGGGWLLSSPQFRNWDSTLESRASPIGPCGTRSPLSDTRANDNCWFSCQRELATTRHSASQRRYSTPSMLPTLQAIRASPGCKSPVKSCILLNIFGTTCANCLHSDDLVYLNANSAKLSFPRGFST